MDIPGFRSLNPDDPADMRAHGDLASRVFLTARTTDAMVEERRQRMLGERVAVVEDAGTFVASFRSWDSGMSVPGGKIVKANAVSGVVVSPTHRRRGLLRDWMSADLRQAKDAGHVASVLWASEATIYGRYGFGPVTAQTTMALDIGRSDFARSAPGSMRSLEANEALAVARDLFERVEARNAGTLTRTPYFWERILGTSAETDNSHRWSVAHVNHGGIVDGIVTYDCKGAGDDWVPDAEVVVVDLAAATDEAEEALWHYCSTIDFARRVTYETSPEVPLASWLTNPRAAKTRSTWDGMWARLLDVPAALSARTYPVPGTVVLQVTDDLAGGTFALEVDATGNAECTPTTAAPDVVLGASDLATVWFGCPHGTASLDVMRSLGRVQVRPEKVGWLSTFFSTSWRRQALTHF